MKVCVYGIWHLGAVTAACLAEAGFETVGLEEDPAAMRRLSEGLPPLFEPGLEELFAHELKNARLSFTGHREAAVGQADVVWITFDTPVDEEDRADVTYVMERIRSTFPYLRDGTVVLVSSQMPVGSIARLERDFDEVAQGRQVAFACSPENLRLGNAIDVFRHPERVIVGIRQDEVKQKLGPLFEPFTDRIIWIGVESAELTKHALNAFLAASVTFINEIASLGEQLGADAREVEQALRSEARIGPKAYIRPGAAFAGGTLARDVTFLGELGRSLGLPTLLIDTILKSNRSQAEWPLRRLKDKLGSLQGRTIAVLGLAYKPGTDAIRRSLAVELVRALARAGATVRAYDPKVTELPETPPRLEIAQSLEDALKDAEALVVMTEWPEFKSLRANQVATLMARTLVVDQNGFLEHVSADERLTYLAIGRADSTSALDASRASAHG